MISVVYFDLLRSEELLEFVRCGPELQEQIPEICVFLKVPLVMLQISWVRGFL